MINRRLTGNSLYQADEIGEALSFHSIEMMIGVSETSGDQINRDARRETFF